MRASDKTLKKNKKRVNLPDLGLGKAFFSTTLKVQVTKKETKKFDFIKI